MPKQITKITKLQLSLALDKMKEEYQKTPDKFPISSFEDKEPGYGIAVANYLFAIVNTASK